MTVNRYSTVLHSHAMQIGRWNNREGRENRLDLRSGFAAGMHVMTALAATGIGGIEGAGRQNVPLTADCHILESEMYTDILVIPVGKTMAWQYRVWLNRAADRIDDTPTRRPVN